MDTEKDDFERGREAERRRIVGVVLAAYGVARLAGEMAIADALDKLATEIEHSA